MYDLGGEQERKGYGLRVICLCVKLIRGQLYWLVLYHLDTFE